MVCVARILWYMVDDGLNETHEFERTKMMKKTLPPNLCRSRQNHNS
jgi:hypothetical protein